MTTERKQLTVEEKAEARKAYERRAREIAAEIVASGRSMIIIEHTLSGMAETVTKHIEQAVLTEFVGYPAGTVLDDWHESKAREEGYETLRRWIGTASRAWR